MQQDVFLFSGTIRENIAYGKTDATDEEIRKAIELAQISDIISDERGGLDAESDESERFQA